MKKLSVILLLCCVGLLLPAQDRTAYDTLYLRMKRMPSDKVIDLADQYLAKSNEDTAIVLFSIAYSRYNESMGEKEKLLCALSFLKTANVYYRQGNYNNAFEFYMKGLKICESCEDKKLLPQFYINIGNVYCTFMDYEKGINCYEKAYKLCHEYPDKQYEYNALTNMAGAYNYMNNAEMAKNSYFKAKQLTEPQDTIRNYMNLLNWGLILLNEKKYQEAVRTFHQSAVFARKHKLEPRYECSSYEELYKVYRELGNGDSTLYYLKCCNRLAEQNGLVDILAQNLKTYSDFYKSKGDMTNSLYYKDRYLTLMDSVFNVREFNRVKNVQYLYEMEKIGKEISSLNAEKSQKEQKIKAQQRVILGIVLGFLTLCTLLIIVYRQKKQLARAYKNLFDINQEIAVSDNYNRSVRLQYEEKLRMTNQKLEDYREQQGDRPDEIEEQSFTSDMPAKYQTSNLADEQKQNLLDAIVRVMETTDEFCKEDFSLEKLSALVNSNNKYVSQVINETYHKNFSNYINEYRIREARVRIADFEHYGNYTIKAIAESVGYKSNTTFVNAFKNITGITPSIFQKKIREEYEK